MTNAIYTQHCAKKFTHVIYVKMILLAGVATLGTRGFFLARRGASFRRRQAHTCLAEGPRHERRSREKKPLFACVTLRLNQNWKPCMESIWHPGDGVACQNQNDRITKYKLNLSTTATFGTEERLAVTERFNIDSPPKQEVAVEILFSKI